MECASLLRLDELICLGDALVRIPRRRYEDRSTPHSSLERIAAHLSLHPHVRGRSLAGDALQYDGHTHFDQDARDGFRRTVTEVRRTLAAREAVPA